jgi:hypothetical protein
VRQAAAHIEHALSNDHIGQRRKLRSEQNGVAAHEPVIRVSGDREAHQSNLLLSRESDEPISTVGASSLVTSMGQDFSWKAFGP